MLFSVAWELHYLCWFSLNHILYIYLFLSLFPNWDSLFSLCLTDSLSVYQSNVSEIPPGWFQYRTLVSRDWSYVSFFIFEDSLIRFDRVKQIKTADQHEAAGLNSTMRLAYLLCVIKKYIFSAAYDQRVHSVWTTCSWAQPIIELLVAVADFLKRRSPPFKVTCISPQKSSLISSLVLLESLSAHTQCWQQAGFLKSLLFFSPFFFEIFWLFSFRLWNPFPVLRHPLKVSTPGWVWASWLPPQAQSCRLASSQLYSVYPAWLGLIA